MRLSYLATGLFVVLASGCGGGSEGGERQACYGNGTCNAGLTCFSNVCVNTTGSGGTLGAAGSGGSGGVPGGTAGGPGGSGGVGGNAGVSSGGHGASGGAAGAAGTPGGTGGITATGGSTGTGGSSVTCGGSTGAMGGVGGIGTAPCWVGDFDGDGTLDCAKAAPTANDLSFFKGLGGGGYSPTAVITTGVVPNSALLLSAPFDMTADGRADLVFGAPSSTGGDLYAFFGNSDGTFSKPSDTLPFVAVVSLPTVGLPGVFDPTSGRTDLFFVNAAHASLGFGELYWNVLHEPPATSGTGYPLPEVVSTDARFVLGSLGNVGPPNPNGAPWMAIGDINGDHNLDGIVIVTTGTMASLTQTAQVYIAYGNGDRTFRSGMNVVPGTVGAVSVQAQDVDSDGNLDLLVGFAKATPKCATTTFYGDGAGNFSTMAP